MSKTLILSLPDDDRDGITVLGRIMMKLIKLVCEKVGFDYKYVVVAFWMYIALC